MLEKTNKKHKKGFISETDISSLLQKYTANTVLALLQEVAQFPGVKLDWNALVKKTSTGISNAREYQMLWRHLAYRNSLLEKLEDGTRPLDDDSDLEFELEAFPNDDDSDLEFELEAFPNVNTEASTEAAACVKVLIASGLPSESSLANSSTVEAPLTINIPNGQSHRGSSENPQPSCSMQGMNITVPVSVQKLPLPTTTSTEGLDTNGSTSANMPPRKKRKPWTPEEDIELIAAVQKCGEGNWANILRGDFNWDRTASQLSQRWNILRKKHGTSILGANSTGSQLSEAQLAARHAMSLALDMPVKNITASCANNTAGATSSSTTSSSVLPTANSEALPVGSSVVQAQSHSQQGSIQTKSFPVVLQGPIQTKSSPMVLSGSAAKSRVISKKVLPKSNFTSDLSLKATAVAVGARIGTSSDAASLRAQAKSTIHIMPSGVSSIKSSMTASTPAHLDSHPSVRYIRTGLAATSASTSSAVTSNTSHPGAVKAATPRVQLNASSEQTHAVNSTSATELPLKPEVKAAEEIKVSDSCSVSGNEPSKEVRVDKAALPKPEAELKHEAAPAEMMESDQVHIINQAEGNENGNGDIMMCSTNEEYENQSAVEEKCGLQNSIKKVSELPDMVTDGCSANVEVLSETKAIDEMQG